MKEERHMTKKEEKAAEVLANRQAAFDRKVQTLTGHVAKRIAAKELREAFAAGMTAEAFAAVIATREPVGAALHSAKADAVKDAGEQARAYVARVREDLIAHGWDINAAAPYPWGRRDFQSDLARAKSTAYGSLTKDDPAKGYQSRRPNNDPIFVVMDDERIARFVENAEREAALYYDAFIVKMVAKVGECESAAIDGSHVWAHSILTVTKRQGVERWHTQQITNTSKLGLRFPQWPSRLLKKGGA